MRDDDDGTSRLVVKYGAGRRIADDDILVVHLRAAERVEDLQDDAHVLHSTYASGEAMTVEYREDNLLPEVYEGLADLPAGSTVVIELSIVPSGNSAIRLADSLYLEVWIQEVRSSGSSTVETLATRDLHRDATPGALLTACRAARTQPNGHVVAVPVALVDHFLAMCAEASTSIKVAQPKKLGPTSDAPGSVIHFLIAGGLYSKLVESLEDGA